MLASFPVEEAKPTDSAAIELMLDAAFGIDRRVKTSYRLREGNQAVQGLSLVVRDAELGLAGGLSFWPLVIGAKGFKALLLGPLVVHGCRQNIGVGRSLMAVGLERAKMQGYGLVILVGDAPYYERVGFKTVPGGQLTLPGPVDPKRFMFLELAPGAMAQARGLVLPPHRFDEISAAFAPPHEA